MFVADYGIEFLFDNGSLYNTGFVRLCYSCLSGEGLKLCLLPGVILFCFYLAKLPRDVLDLLLLV